jgi:hypothetical protein
MVEEEEEEEKKFDSMRRHGGWREARIRYGTNDEMVDKKRRGTRRYLR